MLPGGRSSSSTGSTGTISTTTSAFFVQPFLTAMTSIGLLGRSPEHYDPSLLYSIAPLEKRPRLSSTATTSTTSSTTHQPHRLDQSSRATSSSNATLTTTTHQSSNYKGPMSPELHQAVDVINNIGLALHHRLNWTSLPRTLSNSFYSLFDSIHPACDTNNATRQQLRQSISSCSADVVNIMQSLYDSTISTLIPSLSKFPSDTLTTASYICTNRLKKRFKHLNTSFDQRLKDIISSSSSFVEVTSLPTRPTSPSLLSSNQPTSFTSTLNIPISSPSRRSPPITSSSSPIRTASISVTTNSSLPTVSHTSTKSFAQVVSSPGNQSSTTNTSTPSRTLPTVVSFTPSSSTSKSPSISSQRPASSTSTATRSNIATVIKKFQLFPGTHINNNTKTLVIGDSNLRHLTFDSDCIQTICIPGGKIHHIISFFSNLIPSRHPNLTHIYILIGINDRDTDYNTSCDSFTKLKTILNATRIRFTIFQIPRPPCLTFKQTRNIDLCNAFIRDQFYTLPIDFMTFKYGDIHFELCKYQLISDKIANDLQRQKN